MVKQLTIFTGFSPVYRLRIPQPNPKVSSLTLNPEPLNPWSLSPWTPSLSPWTPEDWTPETWSLNLWSLRLTSLPGGCSRAGRPRGSRRARAERWRGSTLRGLGWWGGTASPSPTGDRGRTGDPVGGRVASYVVVDGKLGSYSWQTLDLLASCTPSMVYNRHAITDTYSRPYRLYKRGCVHHVKVV